MLKSLRIIALLALLPTAWLASQRTFVHRSIIDPREPIYASNYLDARGLGFPWLVTEVPENVGPVPWSQRVFPRNLLALYVVGLIVATPLWIALRLARTLWRRVGSRRG